MTKQRELPVILTADEVRAIQAGRKTQFRRPVRRVPCDCAEWLPYEACATTPEGWQMIGHSGRWSCKCCTAEPRPCPFGKPGDLLWVKETWRQEDFGVDDNVWYATLRYRADGACGLRSYVPLGPDTPTGWRSPVHLPKWAARIWLRVEDVRAERLQNISEEDAKAEGVLCCVSGVETVSAITGETQPVRSYQTGFVSAWQNRYGNKPELTWFDDPWVWAVTFKEVQHG